MIEVKLGIDKNQKGFHRKLEVVFLQQDSKQRIVSLQLQQGVFDFFFY
nr:hypothetical protein [Metabacillus idriensis]